MADTDASESAYMWSCCYGVDDHKPWCRVGRYGIRADGGSRAIGHAHDDGGRAAAGFRGTTGDCVVRSIAIATGIPYREVYEAIAVDMRAHPRMTRGKASPRDGVRREFYEAFLRARGWRFVPTMGFGTGTRVHLRADELPSGRIIVRLSKHMAAVIDGVVHDTHDPSRGGTRCVYGYYTKEAA